MTAQRDSTSQYLSLVLVNTNTPKKGTTVAIQHLIRAYYFGVASPFHEKCSSLPAPSFLLFEQAKRYMCAVPVVPEANTDAKFVYQLLTTEASLNVWRYMYLIMQ